MNNSKLCTCQYKIPIEYVCLDKQCKRKRMFCKACTWDHSHKESVKLLNEWEIEITNDCLVQRIQNVQCSSGLLHALDQIMEITKTELCKAVEKRCSVLKASLGKQVSPLKRIIESISSVSKKQYNMETMEFIIQELDCKNITNQLDQLEATSYQQNKLVCEEIIDVANMLQKMINFCNQAQNVGELGEISRSIQQKLDLKPKYKYKQEINNTFFAYQTQKKPRVVEEDDGLNSYIQTLQQPQQFKKYAPLKQDPPNPMAQSLLQFGSSKAEYVHQPASPYERGSHNKAYTEFNDLLLKSEKQKEKTEKQYIPNQNFFSYRKDQQNDPLKSERSQYMNRDASSKSLHQLQK